MCGPRGPAKAIEIAAATPDVTKQDLVSSVAVVGSAMGIISPVNNSPWES